VRPGVPVVLLMGGSLGLGPLEDAVRGLVAPGRPLDVLLVAGHNRRLRERFARLRPAGQSRLRVFGYVDCVHELMAVADLFVSKPGGLSMTEAVTLGVPTLVIAPLPGQEVANARHLEARGVVRCLGRREPLAEAVDALLADREGRERLAASARGYARRSAARRIAARLVEMADER
jgi:processive 1,2-diacylglycerol beta-glucosyltransferase